VNDSFIITKQILESLMRFRVNYKQQTIGSNSQDGNQVRP